MAMIMQLFTGLSLGVGDIPVDKINCQPVEILDYLSWLHSHVLCYMVMKTYGLHAFLSIAV